MSNGRLTLPPSVTLQNLNKNRHGEDFHKRLKYPIANDFQGELESRFQFQRPRTETRFSYQFLLCLAGQVLFKG